MHALSPLYSSAYSPLAIGFLGALLPFLIIAMIWTLILKGFALWYAARGNQKWWFIVLLIVNTLGLLEIIYLVWFRPASSKHLPSTSAYESSTQA